MRYYLFTFLCTVFLLTAVCPGQGTLGYKPVSAPERMTKMIIYNSGTTDDFVKKCLAGLSSFYPGIEDSVDFNFVSSDGAFDAIVNGQTRVCAVSYQLPVDQHQAFVDQNDRDLKYAQILKDAVCVGVHPDNPLDEISIAELDAMFSSTLNAGWPERITKWNQLGVPDSALANTDITIYGGSPGWGTTEFFRERVLLNGEFAPNYVDADIALGADNIYSVEYKILNDPSKSGIGFMSYRPRRVKLLNIQETTLSQAYAPKAKNLYTEMYPYLTRKLFVYLDYPSLDKAPFQVRELVKFMLSSDGQSIAANLGFLPMTTHELFTARERLGIVEVE